MQAVQVYSRHFQSETQKQTWSRQDQAVNRFIQNHYRQHKHNYTIITPTNMAASKSQDQGKDSGTVSPRGGAKHQTVMVAIRDPSSVEALDFALHTTEPEDTIYLAHVTPQRRLSYQDIYRLQEDQRLVGKDLSQSVPLMEHLLDQCEAHNRRCIPLVKTNMGRSKYGVAQTLLSEAEQKKVDRIVVKSPRHKIRDMGFGVTQVIRRNADTDVDVVSSTNDDEDPHLTEMKRSAQNIWDSHAH